MALKQYSVFTVLLYSWCISYIPKLYCINLKNNYVFVFYYQFGVNVFRHDDFEFISFTVILQVIVPN